MVDFYVGGSFHRMHHIGNYTAHIRRVTKTYEIYVLYHKKKEVWFVYAATFAPMKNISLGIVNKLRLNLFTFTINDLIKIEPQQLYNNYGLSKIQYTNLVLMLVCVCRKYSINSMYSPDDYYNVNKIDTKKRSSKNGK